MNKCFLAKKKKEKKESSYGVKSTGSELKVLNRSKLQCSWKCLPRRQLFSSVCEICFCES